MESVKDILARQNGSNSRPSTDHQTDPQTTPPSDSQSDRLRRGGRVGLTSEEGLIPSAIYPCRFCGKVEPDHHCPIAWKWDVTVPDDSEELALYLRTVWGIRWAGLIAVECSAAAVRTALEIVGVGKADGTVYQDPAGLIVKIARRVQNATNRAGKRRQ